MLSDLILTPDHKEKLVNWTGVSLALVICTRQVECVNIPLPILTCICVVAILLCVGRQSKVCNPAAAFAGIYAVSLFIHPEPQFIFRAARFLAFCVGFAMFSPLITNSRLTIIRASFFKTSMWLMSLIVVVSFGILIYCMLTHKPISDHTYFYYGFKGICDKGMTLSPMAAMVAIFALYKSLHSISALRFTGWIALSGFGMITCVGAGSRIAVAGLVIATITLIILSAKEIKVIFKNVGTRIALICALITCGALTPHAMDVINYKNEVGQKHESLIYSRQSLWQTRVDEIKSSPFIGIGYANEFHRPDSKNAPGDLTIIEPGSGWLSLMSYGGILGTGTFLWFLISLFRKLKSMWQSDDIRPKAALTVALLAFFLIDSIAEGWLMFAGALMFPYFWLTCSIPFNNPALTQ